MPIHGLYYVPHPSSLYWNMSLVVCLEGKGLQELVWEPSSVVKAASFGRPEVLQASGRAALSAMGGFAGFQSNALSFSEMPSSPTKPQTTL